MAIQSETGLAKRFRVLRLLTIDFANRLPYEVKATECQKSTPGKGLNRTSQGVFVATSGHSFEMSRHQIKLF